MKKYLFPICVFLPLFGSAQKIDTKSLIGLWQKDDCGISAGFLETYQFFSNGRFAFHPSQYDGLKRILSIIGYYNIVRDSLFFSPDSTEELIGGYPIPPSPPEGVWELEGGNVKVSSLSRKNIQPNYIEYGCTLSTCEKDTLMCPCIEIEGDLFYRISQDPNKY